MDGELRKTSFYYTDNFSDGNQSRNARAYPVQVTDADNFSSWTSYHFHTGQVINTQDSKGMVTSTVYDAADRVERVNNVTSGAYTRYGYYSTVTMSWTKFRADQPEVTTEEHFDGVGRVRHRQHFPRQRGRASRRAQYVGHYGSPQGGLEPHGDQLFVGASRRQCHGLAVDNQHFRLDGQSDARQQPGRLLHRVAVQCLRLRGRRHNDRL
ncbi:MAG: hypothetical protein WKF84_24830 [Pyrinomonadaceae bacterium]